jgi:hypothetical protein
MESRHGGDGFNVTICGYLLPKNIVRFFCPILFLFDKPVRALDSLAIGNSLPCGAVIKTLSERFEV